MVSKHLDPLAQNPELNEISNSLINALKDLEKGLTHSLDVLLKTNFTHLIDAPSLSLPILCYITDSSLRPHRITSTLLLSWDIFVIIMPALRATLFFSADPQIRGTAALAVGSLSKELGL